jgi:hypothetical protein
MDRIAVMRDRDSSGRIVGTSLARLRPTETMRTTSLLMLIGLGIDLALVGCGPGTGQPGTANGDASDRPANIPQSDTFSMVSQSQAAALCDYIAATNGGYGRSMTCPNGGTEMNYAAQSDCVADAAPIGYYCPTFTVGQAEDCAIAVGLDICNAPLDPACNPYEACLTQLALAP